MSEYDDVVESTLVQAEQAVERAEGARSSADERSSRLLSLYISGISLLVAVAALLTAFAADDWLSDSLECVADQVDLSALRVEQRCHQIRKELAGIRGVSIDQSLEHEIQRTSRDLARLSADNTSLVRGAEHLDRAHFTLATAIMFLQMATGLAAVMSLVNRPQLLYTSLIFACGGIFLTAVGVMKYLA